MSEHDINTPDATHESEDKNKIVDETAVEDHFKEKTAISRHTRAADNHQTEHNARRASKDGTSASPEKQAVSSKIKPLFDGIYDLVDESNIKISEVFQTLPDRRLLDYYRSIKRPFSLYMIKVNITGMKYSNVSQFIRDLVQITWNARSYNRKDSWIYTHALILDQYIHEKVLPTLSEDSSINKSDIQYPDLGPLPEIEIEDPEDENDENDSEKDYNEDEDDEPEDDEYEETATRRGRRSSRRRETSVVATTHGGHNTENKRVKRGRPPIVDKPYESRIKAILRTLRKTKDSSGRSLCIAFDKLPDPKVYPHYYQEIQTPVAIDSIRKKIKRRLYHNVEEFMKDMNLMFDNARLFNTDESLIYKDSVALQGNLIKIHSTEMKKLDSAYQDEDELKNGKIPLDQFEKKGTIYKVGDWVHINNPNDPAKPTVGQIFRIWQTPDGQKWINSCWYYRPEQTVHRIDKCFYENEVVKSGQYSDHLVDEVIEKCFVMFFTKYQRGRPIGFEDGKRVYCCESRYNENEKMFNRIRTWKACLPDEVRSTDYPMVYFERPIPLRRVESPLKNMLTPNSREDMPIPEPQLGAPNAPPIRGGVYRRPYDPNNPPEHPTPPDIAAQIIASSRAIPHLTIAPSGASTPAKLPQPHHQHHQSQKMTPLSATPLGTPGYNNYGQSNSAVPRTPSSKQVNSPLLNQYNPLSSLGANKFISHQPSLVFQQPQSLTTPMHQKSEFTGYMANGPPTTFLIPDQIQQILHDSEYRNEELLRLEKGSNLNGDEVSSLASDYNAISQRGRGQMLWMNSPPVYIPTRIQDSQAFVFNKLGLGLRETKRKSSRNGNVNGSGNPRENDKSIEDDDDDDDDSYLEKNQNGGIAGIPSIGHSVKYVSWYLENKRRKIHN